MNNYFSKFNLTTNLKQKHKLSGVKFETSANMTIKLYIPILKNICKVANKEKRAKIQNLILYNEIPFGVRCEFYYTFFK